LSLVTAVLAAAAGAVAVADPVPAESLISVEIEKHAQLTSDGSVVFRVHVTCGPLPGSPDFREGHAGAGQLKTGAGAEGGLSPDVVCDGVERVYTAGVSLITEEPFRFGPANASAAVIACNVVGDAQVCVEDSAHRSIRIHGPRP
jgi:hypothetical protein